METDKLLYTKKRDFITEDSVDSLVLDRDPDFIDYLFFHNIIDKFCWLIKLHYADKNTVKRKRYRIDTLFQRYVYLNHFRIEKAQKCLAQEGSVDRLEFYLAKGWHNELVRSDPLHPDYLHIGTQLSGWGGPGSGGMVAWNIVQSYYAFYEFYSCIACAVKPDLVIEGHKRVAQNSITIFSGQSRIE